MPVYEPCLILRPDDVIIDDTARVDSFTKLEGKITIGKRVHVASFVHLGAGGGETILEDDSCVATSAVILSGSSRVDGYCFSAAAPAHWSKVDRLLTRIGKGAIVYAHATVLPGLTIGEGAVIAAGAVVTKDVPAWEIWAGVPAQFVKRRKVVACPDEVEEAV